MIFARAGRIGEEMSTKIHHGFVLPKMSLNELHKLVLRMRERAECFHNELYFERIARLCCDILDDYTLLPQDEFLKRVKKEDENFDLDYSPLTMAQFIIRRHQQKIKETMERDPSFDFDCSMALIPGKRKIYMLFYAEDEAYWEMLKTFQEVKEYPYWNNTDPPDGMSWSRWQRRGAEWDRALSVHHSEIPSLCGFSVDLVLPGFIMPDGAQILASIPTLEQRVKHHAWVSLFFKARDYLKTDEGKERLKQEEQRLAGILQTVYTKDDLLKPLKDRNQVDSPQSETKDFEEA